MATVTLTAVSVWRQSGGRTSLHRHDDPSTGRQFVRDVFEIGPSNGVALPIWAV
jgi:hypothetical protein